jgi:hypothetical protein
LSKLIKLINTFSSRQLPHLREPDEQELTASFLVDKGGVSISILPLISALIL